MIVRMSLVLLLSMAFLGLSETASAVLGTRSQNFDTDPGWTALNNTTPGLDFGYSFTNDVGGVTTGEAGGTIDRIDGTAYYADTDFPLSLTPSDAFSFTGSFVFKEDEVPFDYDQDSYLGFFNKDSMPDSRVPSLALRVREGFDAQQDGHHFRLEVEYRQSIGDRNTGTVHSPDGGITAGAGYGVKHTVWMSYDPNGNNGGGSFEAVINDGTTDIIDRTVGSIDGPVNLHSEPFLDDFEFNAFGLFIRGREGAQVVGGKDYQFFVDDVTYTVNVPFTSSGDLYTWGDRIADGSWGDTNAWRVSEGGGPFMDATDFPILQPAPDPSDPVQVLSGTVSVDTGDQGAFSLQVDASAGVNVASGFTLSIQTSVTTDPNSTLVLAGTLGARSIDAQGLVTFSDGVLNVNGGTIASAATSSDATIANSSELSIGQMTVGTGDSLVKQSGGTLILDQSGGANSFAAGSSIDVEGGAVAGVNDQANSALGSADVNLAGGNLVLSSKQASAAAFDVAVDVTSDTDIRAAQVAGADPNETVTLGGVNGVNVAAAVEATIKTDDGYTLNVDGDVGGDGQLSLVTGAKVNITGAVTPAIVEFQGDMSNITGTANIAPGQAYSFAPTDDTPDMSIGFAIGGDVGVTIEGQVDGSVELAGGASYTGATRIVLGALRIGGGALDGDFDGNGVVNGNDFLLWQQDPGVGTLSQWENNYGQTGGGGGLPGGSLLQFEGAAPGDLAVLESGDATFERNIGTGAGEVNWAGSGGFASRGGASGLIVTLEGGAELSFSSADAGFNGNALQLGSPFADGKVELTNNLNLEGAERIVQIGDNPDSDQDFVEISGNITSIAGGELTVTEENGGGSFEGGLLVLSGINSMEKLRIEDASVDAVQGVGLPNSANLEFNGNNDSRPAVWVGSGTFERNIGPGAGEVSWDDPGGFGARGGDLTVTLHGGAVLDWESATAGMNGQDLQLGSNHSDAVTTFVNGAVGWEDDGMGGMVPGDRAFQTFGDPNSEADEIHINGDFVVGFNNIDIEGIDSRVIVNGNMTTAEEIITRGNVIVLVNGVLDVFDQVSIKDTSNLFINGTAMVEVDDFQTDDVGGIGGVGTIHIQSATGRVGVDVNAFLRPGPDLNAVGTLNVSLEASLAMVRIDNNATYEMEFTDDGGLMHDSVSIVGPAAAGFGQFRLGEELGDQWNLELSALEDLTGLVSPAGEYDLFVWDDQVDFFLDTVFINPGSDVVNNVVLNSTEFNVSLATVNYEVMGDFSGRVFVTGLSLLSGVTAVPEPTSAALLSGLAIISLLGSRSRCRKS